MIAGKILVNSALAKASPAVQYAGSKKYTECIDVSIYREAFLKGSTLPKVSAC